MALQEKLTKSEQIRRFHDEGWKVAEIAQLMDIRYQFAYNVVTYYVRTTQLEVSKYAAAGLDDNHCICE